MLGMHLRLIEIENFRGIKKLALKLDVVTAIFGEGSFGKTSLLEALQMCLTSGSGNGDFPVFQIEDFHVPPGDEPAATRLSITMKFREGVPHQWSNEHHTDLQSVMSDWRDGRREVALQVVATRKQDGLIETDCKFIDAMERPIYIENISPVLRALRELNPVLILRSPYMSHPAALPDSVQDSDASSSDESVEPSSPLLPAEQYVLSLYKKALSQPDRLTRKELADSIEALSGIGDSYAGVTEGRSDRYKHLVKEIAETATRYAPGVNLKMRLARLTDSHQVVALLALIGTLLEVRGTLKFNDAADPIFAIENLEANLHPIVLASIWDLIAQIPVQKLIITNSDDLLACVPIRSLRRVVRHAKGSTVYDVQTNSLSTDDIRRIGYHLRLNRSDAILARCWLLVEGESEFWLMPGFAHILGYDFRSEGVRLVEFAQCGIEPLIRLAKDLGIEWLMVADGDNSGQAYATMARNMTYQREYGMRIHCMQELDIEHHLCKTGFLDVYQEAAGHGHGGGYDQRGRGHEFSHERGQDRGKNRRRQDDSIHGIVKDAVKRRSKPNMIMKVIEEGQNRGVQCVSPFLRNVVESAVKLARSAEPEFSLSGLRSES